MLLAMQSWACPVPWSISWDCRFHGSCECAAGGLRGVERCQQHCRPSHCTAVQGAAAALHRIGARPRQAGADASMAAGGPLLSTHSSLSQALSGLG